MHLVALKNTLIYLDLSWNPQVTDDAIPSLCYLSKLDTLHLQGTGVSIQGLRKLASSVSNNNRTICLTASPMCEKYIQSENKSNSQAYPNLRSRPLHRIRTGYFASTDLRPCGLFFFIGSFAEDESRSTR